MKNNLITLILFSVLLLSLGSCDDNTPEILPHTIVKGRVLEYGTNEPVAGAKVNLLGGEWSLGGSFGSIQDTFLTDADGYYEFTFKPKEGYIYYLDAEKEQYWDFIPTLDFSDYKENNLDIVLDPEAYLELHVKNINPFDNNDNIRYSGFWSGGAAQDNLGVNIDFFDIKTVRGNRGVHIYWNVSKNGNSTFYEDTVYCKKHDMTSYEIFY